MQPTQIFGTFCYSTHENIYFYLLIYVLKFTRTLDMEIGLLSVIFVYLEIGILYLLLAYGKLLRS